MRSKRGYFGLRHALPCGSQPSIPSRVSDAVMHVERLNAVKSTNHLAYRKDNRPIRRNRAEIDPRCSWP